jgi:hypothetical protein
MVLRLALGLLQCAALWLSMSCNINTLPLSFSWYEDKKKKMDNDDNENKKRNNDDDSNGINSSNDSNGNNGNNGNNDSTANHNRKEYNNNTLQVQSWMQQMFAMNDAMYMVAKILGVQQQWFLFDNPPNKAIWFRIVGETKAGTQYDLHAMTLRHVQRRSFGSSITSVLASLSNTWSTSPSFVPNTVDRRTMLYTPVPNPTSYTSYPTFLSQAMPEWQTLYGTHRFRKLFQKLTDKRKRFHSFTVSYANGLNKIWKEEMAEQCGELVKVTCHGCWVPLEHVVGGGSDAAKVGIQISRGIAWKVVLGEKERTDKVKSKKVK